VNSREYADEVESGSIRICVGVTDRIVCVEDQCYKVSRYASGF